MAAGKNTLFAQDQIQAINDALSEAEKKTNGEIVPYIVKQSDKYPAANLRLAIGLSLITPCLLYFIDLLKNPFYLLWAQLIFLIIGYFLATYPKVRRLLIPAAEKREEVQQRAMQVFLDNKLHTTKERNGILIFVSLLERRVELLTDIGIDDKVDLDQWHDIVSQLINKIKENNLEEGIITAIDKCAELLARHFPKSTDDINELPDSIIIEDE